MDEFEKKKRELLQPLFFEAGAALLDCQHFEYGVALALFHLSRIGQAPFAPADLARILDNQDKRTAGQLVTMLKKDRVPDAALEKILEEGLAARNILVHRVLADNIEMLPKPETRALLLKEVKRLRRKVGDANKALEPLVTALSELLDGVTQEAMLAEVKALFSWSYPLASSCLEGRVRVRLVPCLSGTLLRANHRTLIRSWSRHQLYRNDITYLVN
ncbi:MAG TPA: hypothetical protein VNY24_14350 [Candidatus Acidoferrales bacterium]|jgi:hypothetical protein|nr:hypothetical protein [Candidatus Acidoferrales bacterium]